MVVAAMELWVLVPQPLERLIPAAAAVDLDTQARHLQRLEVQEL